MDWQAILITLLLALGAAAYSIGAASVRHSIRRALLRPIAQRFDFRPVDDEAATDDQATLQGDWAGNAVRVSHETTPWYQADRIRIRLKRELPLAGEVRFRRRGRIHEFAHRIGLIPDIDPVDRDFHRAIVPEAEHDAEIGPLISDPGLREAVLRLVTDRRTTVAVASDGIEIRYSGRRFVPGAGLRERVRPAAIQADLDTMDQLGDAANSALRVHEPPARPEAAPDALAEGLDDEWLPLAEAIAGHRLGSLLLLGPMLVFVGPAVLLWGVNYPPITWDLYLIGAGAGAVLLALYAGLAIRVLRGRTRSLRDFLLFVVGAALGLLTLAPGALAGLNGLLDGAQLTPTAAAVERRLGDGHHLHVRTTDPPGRTLTVAVPRAAYEELERGDEIDVLVRPGALGFPWLVGADVDGRE